MRATAVGTRTHMRMRPCLVELQVLHKAPIKEPKHIEHLLNERRTQVLLLSIPMLETNIRHML
jgi:hypothetical protein